MCLSVYDSMCVYVCVCVCVCVSLAMGNLNSRCDSPSCTKTPCELLEPTSWSKHFFFSSVEEQERFVAVHCGAGVEVAQVRHCCQVLAQQAMQALLSDSGTRSKADSWVLFKVWWCQLCSFVCLFVFPFVLVVLALLPLLFFPSLLLCARVLVTWLLLLLCFALLLLLLLFGLTPLVLVALAVVGTDKLMAALQIIRNVQPLAAVCWCNGEFSSKARFRPGAGNLKIAPATNSTFPLIPLQLLLSFPFIHRSPSSFPLALHLSSSHGLSCSR